MKRFCMALLKVGTPIVLLLATMFNGTPLYAAICQKLDNCISSNCYQCADAEGPLPCGWQSVAYNEMTVYSVTPPESEGQSITGSGQPYLCSTVYICEPIPTLVCPYWPEYVLCGVTDSVMMQTYTYRNWTTTPTECD